MSAINETSQWRALGEHREAIAGLHLRNLIQDEDRCTALVVEHDGIILDFSRERVVPTTMDMLFDLANAAMLEQKIAAMASGQHINSTEDRAVLHYALRVPKSFGRSIVVDGQNVLQDVHAVLDKIDAFSSTVRSGQWLGATGKRLTNVISIGIGGSYLGPEFVYEALRVDPVAQPLAAGRRLRFLANVDPVDVFRATGEGSTDAFDPETTLVVIVSKTFTTAETILNAKTIRDWLLRAMPSVPAADVVRQHMVAVSTADAKAISFGIAPENIFGFWDWVGGRYSVCSAVGILPIALQYSFEIARQFLDGAHNMDQHFFETPVRFNLPINLGLLGVWNSSFLGFGARAILPYSQALTRFAAHIQQVDMESNGKRVAVDGTVMPFDCGEINFGEPGTNGQHSFYQLIHQGRIIPCEFIAFCKSQQPISIGGEVVCNHDELMSNFFAQPDALACGKTPSELEAEGVNPVLIPHKEFAGNRPSLSLLLPELSAYRCGQLLALYEHRVAVQGFIWGINSFDQWGVELGKVLATKVRNQITASRSGDAVSRNGEISGFNPSTTFLLQRYLNTTK